MNLRYRVIKSFFPALLFFSISFYSFSQKNSDKGLQTDSQLMQIRKGLNKEDSLMKKGVLQEPDTKKFYFTGYDYKTLYDWDQYFESIVEIYMGWPDEYIKNGVTIFLDHQKEDGMIVRSVPGNEFHNQEHLKPFLCQISLLVFDHFSDTAWLSENYFNRLKKYLDYWLIQMDKDKNGLSEWMSAPHTGMDNQHERAGWWGDRISEGVDLNCYLVREMRAFARIADMKGQPKIAEKYRQDADRKAELIRTLLWDEKQGFFYDHRYKGNALIPVKSISGFAPLWAGVATPEQARRIIFGQLMNPSEFWSAWPVPALARSEPGYSEKQMANDLGCSWRANTWISTNYMVYHGLKNYGYDQLADVLAYKTEELMKNAGDREYYHSESGTGTGLNPFWGWSLLGYFFIYESKSKIDITHFKGDDGKTASLN